jgi:hypothetical protein
MGIWWKYTGILIFFFLLCMAKVTIPLLLYGMAIFLLSQTKFFSRSENKPVVCDYYLCVIIILKIFAATASNTSAGGVGVFLLLRSLWAVSPDLFTAENSQPDRFSYAD